MKISNGLLIYMRGALTGASPCISNCRHTSQLRSRFNTQIPRQTLQRRFQHNPADDPNWQSVVDKPATLVRERSRHGPGLIILALIPITAFALGSWQVQRLGWKTELIARFEDRLVRDPLPLPPTIDPSAISEFDYRRVFTKGRFRHDQEMLIGPRVHDGEDGFLVVTPLERDGGSKVLVNRGWIARDKKDHASRPEGLPKGDVIVEGLLREPWKKNMFTPDNKPEKGEFYFPDVEQMAAHTGSQPVWIEVTMPMDLYVVWDRQEKGIPIGRAAEVNLRNNHTQYIFTWYSLSLATSIMLYMVMKKPAKAGKQLARRSVEW